MPKRKLTDEQIEQACMLREEGLSTQRIINRLALDISPGAIEWHFLLRGADRPDAIAQDLYRNGGRVHQRGNHMVRRFTPEEDTLIQREAIAGRNPSEIGRMVQRGPNTIKGRLATLARYEERSSR